MGPFHDQTAETLARPALEVLQKKRFAELLSALENNKFYRAHYPPSAFSLQPSAFSNLPFVTKSDIARDQSEHPPYGTNLNEPLANYCRFNQTSGSSGAGPIRWLDTPQSWEWMLRTWSAIFHASGVLPGDRVCFTFSFGPFLGFWTAFEAAVRYGTLCLPSGGMSTAARLRYILENQATVICCTPTYALRMAEVARDEKIDMSASKVRLLIVAGEPGGSIPQTRARIESEWNARVADHHGMTETGPVSFECSAGKLHIIESEFIAESIDPKTLQPVAGGEIGELVLTNLGRSASPLIRYRTGDLVKLRRDSCACGRNFATLDGGILGRADDMVIVRGVNVYPGAVEDAIRSIADVMEYRVEISRQREMNELKVIVEAHDAITAVKHVSDALQRVLNLRVGVECVAPGTLPRFEMKAKRFVLK